MGATFEYLFFFASPKGQRVQKLFSEQF